MGLRVSCGLIDLVLGLSYRLSLGVFYMFFIFLMLEIICFFDGKYRCVRR